MLLLPEGWAAQNSALPCGPRWAKEHTAAIEDEDRRRAGREVSSCRRYKLDQIKWNGDEVNIS